MIDPTLNQLLTPSPQPVIAITLTIIWILEFKIYPLKQTKKTKRFRASYKSIYIAITTSIITTVSLTITQIYNIQNPELQLIRNTGIAIMATGLIIRYWSLKTLGKNFNREIKVDRKQKLVSKGPYKKTRHPSYLGLILIVTSIPIILGQPIGIIITIILMTITIKWRMDYEEKKMEEKIGERYREWKKTRYRLIPLIY